MIEHVTSEMQGNLILGKSDFPNSIERVEGNLRKVMSEKCHPSVSGPGDILFRPLVSRGF